MSCYGRHDRVNNYINNFKLAQMKHMNLDLKYRNYED